MEETMRLVQLSHPALGRKVAMVAEPSLILLSEIISVYDLSLKAIDANATIANLVERLLSEDRLSYTPIYEGESEWSLLPSFDCPNSPFNCLVAGTGLTHKNSALNRQMMHAPEQNNLTDSMKMYQWGVEGGQPAVGTIGRQPEWFYKGTGAVLKGHGQPLVVPPFADDGGEEPEIAGVYVVDRSGNPYRVGFTTGNEFSDHVMEKKNYLYLAPSKLRNCSIGPELVVDANFKDIKGTVQIFRDSEVIWSSSIQTGEHNMAHSLDNLEYHHFKYADHRLPLRAHVHYFGADAFSFGCGVSLQSGDEMLVHWEGMGRALINKVVIDQTEESLVEIKRLTHTGAKTIAH